MLLYALYYDDGDELQFSSNRLFTGHNDLDDFVRHEEHLHSWAFIGDFELIDDTWVQVVE